MSGYGSADDEAQRVFITIEERVELARSQLPKGAGTRICLECLESIPEARRKAMPGTCLCVECQSIKDDIKHTFKQPWAT